MVRTAAHRLARTLAFVSFVAIASSLLVFALLELSPALRRAAAPDGIRYYGLQRRYVPDPVLVFVPAPGTPLPHHAVTRGDLHAARYGIEAPPIRFRMTWNEWGFRSNAGEAPWHALVIGDSYVEIGERDDDTLSERLHRETGGAAFNLGRGWYGPHQYVELLRRFGPSLRPRYALFCFFTGNDVENVEEYARWARGGSYYDWGTAQRAFPVRYAIALADARRYFGDELAGWWRSPRATLPAPVAAPPPTRATAAAAASSGAPVRTPVLAGAAHPRVGVVALGGTRVPMRFAYHPQPRSAGALLESEGWRTLRELLAEFRAVAVAQGIVPVVVSIPTKFEVYAGLLTPESGGEVRADAARLAPFLDSAAEALRAAAGDAGVALVDLLPDFRARAARGELLYYSFDSHWNPAGRQAAAERIAQALGPADPAIKAGRASASARPGFRSPGPPERASP
jgi:hypothetical protein